MPFSTVSGISASASSSSSTPILFRHVCHANHSAKEKYTGSNLYISMHLLWKLSNTWANSSVSLSMYRSWNSTMFSILKFSQTLFAWLYSESVIFPSSDCYRFLSCLEIFHWIFTHYPCHVDKDLSTTLEKFVEVPTAELVGVLKCAN